MEEALTQSDNLNIYQKLAKIRKIADTVSKSKKGYNYSYSDITEILAKVTAGMEKYHISLIPMIDEGTAEVKQNIVLNTKVSKTGEIYEQKTTEMLVSARMQYLWINDDNPQEYIKVPWFIVGSQSDPSQAYGSALTYCTRYFLTSFFQIAQVDGDVDAYRSKQKAAEASEEKAVAEGIIQQVDTLVKTYLADNPDNMDAVKKFMAKYAKGSNYLSIKDPTIAAKLLEDFTNTYINAKKEVK